MLKKLVFWIAICLATFVVFAEINKNIYAGTTKTGFNHFPKGNNISPKMALEFAKPFLEYSYNLRKKNRPEEYNEPRSPIEHMILRGDFYYVTRDSYDSERAAFYIPYAIKINKNTGKVIKPSVTSKYSAWWQTLISNIFY